MRITSGRPVLFRHARMDARIQRESCGWQSSCTQRLAREFFSWIILEPTRSVDLCKHSVYTHFPKDRNCEICQRTKITRVPCRRRIDRVRAENFGDLKTARHKVLSEGCEPRNNHRFASVVQDLTFQWIQSYPCKTKTSQETQRSLQKFVESDRKPKVIYTDNSLEFGKVCEDLSWNHCTSTSHRSETNGIAERAVRRVKEGTSAVLLQSGLDENCLTDSMECCIYLRNIQDFLSDGKKKLRTKDVLENHLKDQSFRLNHWLSITLSLERKSYLDCSLDTLCTRHCGWRHCGVGNDGRIGNLSKKTQYKGSDISQRKWTIHFPVEDERMKFVGGDQELKTSTLIRQRPIRGENQRDFLGESEGSPPPPQDSFPDAGEAMNDIWSMSGNFIYRHHVELRVKLYSLREESFSIPLKYIDVSRNYSYKFGCQTRETHRWLLEYRWVKRLVWSLNRFHSVYFIGRETSRRTHVLRGETDGKTAYIQARSSMARALEVNGKARQAEGEAKVVEWKAPSGEHENYEGFISLNLRTRSSKKRSRIFVRNWKHQWILSYLTRPARKTSLGRPVVNPMRSNQNLRVFWKAVNPQECERKNLSQNIMRTMSQEKWTVHCNITIWYTNWFLRLKQWRFRQQKQQWIRNGRNLKRFRRGTWQKSEVNQRWSMKQGRRAQKFILPYWWTSVIWRMPKWRQSTKKIKVDLYSETTLWKMRTAKVMDIISRLQGDAEQAADAVSAYTEVKMKDAPKLLKIPKSECPDFWIRLPRHKMAKITVQYGRPSRSSWAESVRSSFSRTILGKAIWESLVDIRLGESFQIGNAYSYTVKKGCLESIQ